MAWLDIPCCVIRIFKSVYLCRLRIAKQVVTRTYTVSIRNQSRVFNDLDSLGFAASKLWNVGRWACERVWSEIGYIPSHTELTAYLKSHERYDDLHSQSTQRVLQELAEAFNGWLERPSTFLFAKETGAFVPQEQVTS